MGTKTNRLVTAGLWALFAVVVAPHSQTIAISGMVKRTNGTAIKGATVWLAHQNAVATTDANGAFTLTGQTVQQISPVRRDNMSCMPQLKSNMLYFSVIVQFAEVKVDVFSLIGRHVASLVNQNVGPGNYRLPADAVLLPAEIYCLRLKVGPAVSYFKMPVVSQHGSKPLKLSTVDGFSPSVGMLAKGSATVDSLFAGCADCIAQGKAIATYSGVYAFTLANAAYTPPKYIVNSSALFSYTSIVAATFTSVINGKTYFDHGGDRALSIRNFVFAGDSVRYVVETNDTITWEYYISTYPLLYSDTTINTVTTQSYSDPVTSPQLSFWDKTFSNPPAAGCSEFLRNATFNGAPVAISEKYVTASLSLISKFSNDIGLLYAAANGSFTLTQVNGMPVNANTLIYLPFHPSFYLDKDSCYGFAGTKLLYRPWIFAPDTLSYSFSLLLQPQGMTIANDSSVCWLPAASDAGPHDINVRLTDAKGVSDTLALRVSILNPTSRWVYSTDTSNGTGISKVTMGYIDSSKIAPRYAFGKYDSTYHPGLGMSSEVYEYSSIANCSADSARIWFWQNHIPILKNPSITEGKALYKTDTISVRTVSVDAVSSATYLMPTFYHSAAVFSPQMGLISYVNTVIGGYRDSSGMYLQQYNGQPFDTASIVYLK
jgi:hypothetical protein